MPLLVAVIANNVPYVSEARLDPIEFHRSSIGYIIGSAIRFLLSISVALLISLLVRLLYNSA